MPNADKRADFSLASYIEAYYGGNQSEFARANGVTRQQVTKWLKGGFIVVGHRLYSLRRALNAPYTRGVEQ